MELLLGIQQVQKLSPQMVQSMNILQMSMLELQEYVEKILMENPVLDLEAERKEEERRELRHKVEWLMTTDRQNRWYYQEEGQNLMELVDDIAEESLYEHLRGQLDLGCFPAHLSIAVDCILSGLNDNGYLEETTEELAQRSGQTLKTVKKAEELVRSLEPAGVGARTLSECLALQLERNGENGLAMTLARHHLEDIAQDHYHHISRETGATRGEIQQACKRIRELNPRPGSSFAVREAPGYIIPDLLVTEEDGKLVITSGEDLLPALKISSYYQDLMKQTQDQEVRDYLTDKVSQAGWVVKSIEQRRSTMLNCARVIVERQEPFFRQGADFLQPLTLADVAEEIGVHESTVSRAVKGKYIQCIHGAYPMSHLFSRALSSDSGETVSAESVKARIRELIGEEDKKKPWSDQKLCDLLAAQGITLSRRTVAKYRDELGIPPATGRKEF